MLYTDNLEKTILFEPAKRCNRLQIVSGFTDCDRIISHVTGLVAGTQAREFKKCEQIDLILGMYNSVSEKKHNKLKFLLSNTLNPLDDEHLPRFNLYYISQNKEVHSKIYTWFVDDTPKEAFVGSANYSIEAFQRRRECMEDSDPIQTAQYFNSLLPDTVNCLQTNNLKFSKKKTNTGDGYDPDNADYDYYMKLTPVATCTVSLLTAKGTVGYGSSINWGHRRNGIVREPNQAYIPYNKPDKVEGFFPDRENPNDVNCPPFRVITKDGGICHMRMAQGGNKALHSVESNSILGRWLRKQMGQPAGCFITLEMLQNYGKTAVTFKKYADGTYLLEF